MTLIVQIKTDDISDHLTHPFHLRCYFIRLFIYTSIFV